MINFIKKIRFIKITRRNIHHLIDLAIEKILFFSCVWITKTKLFKKFATVAYHLWYYNNKIWKKTRFMGLECKKIVSDMWIYQEIIFDLKPTVIVEFGSWEGGATLFFSMLLQTINKNSKVLGVDINGDRVSDLVKKNKHIEFMPCSSLEKKVTNKIIELRKRYPGPMFIILDSDHHKNHVLSEMESIRKIMKKGDYLVVEDTNINGHPVFLNFGPGPMEAVKAYFKKYPKDYIVDKPREEKFGLSAASNGFLVKI